MKRRRTADEHAATNLEIALLILTDTEGYGGETALAVRWARLVAEGYERMRANWGVAA